MLDNLANYVRDNGTVVISLTLANGSSSSAAVSFAEELPFRAEEIMGRIANYEFVWDGFGLPLDSFGRRIVAIRAAPLSERSGSLARVFP